MKTTLIDSLSFEDGTIYSIVEKRRLPLAYCKPTLEIYEHSTTVPILGKGCEVKTHSMRLIVCDDIVTTREITTEYLQNVTRLEINAEIQGGDGVFRECHFDSINPVEIDVDGAWIFEVSAIPNELKSFLKM
jgi:hypothetical protein